MRYNGVTMRTATIEPAQETPCRVKFTVDEFERMCEAGIFGEDDRIELIDGELYEMPPAGEWHDAGVNALNMTFTEGSGPRPIAHVQNTVRLSGVTQPMPDLALLRYRDDYYRSGRPTPDDILLAVEVSDSSVRFDRNTKLPRYAAAGVPEVWIVTREPAAIEVYREPRDGQYTELRTFRPGESVSPLARPDLRIEVARVTG